MEGGRGGNRECDTSFAPVLQGPVFIMTAAPRSCLSAGVKNAEAVWDHLHCMTHGSQAE